MVRSLEQRIETALEDRFGLSLVVVVRTHRQLRAVVVWARRRIMESLRAAGQKAWAVAR